MANSQKAKSKNANDNANAKTTGAKAGVKTAQKSTKSVLEAELGLHEKLLWSSRPGAGAFAMAHMRGVLYGMPLIMLALLWQGVILKLYAVPYIGVFTWVFTALGVALTAVPLVALLRGRIYVFYALTSKRLMILSLFPKHEVKSFAFSSLTGVYTKDINFGKGTLVIEASGAHTANPLKADAAFYGIDQVRKIEDAINMILNSKAARRAGAQRARIQQLQQPQNDRQSAVPQAVDQPSFVPSALPPSSSGPSPSSPSSSSHGAAQSAAPQGAPVLAGE